MTEAAGNISAALIWCPFPDSEVAASISKSLLDEGYIACANILPEIHSLFVWNGERDEGKEAAALLKTNSALLEDAITRLAALHPYDTPAIIGWRCDSAPPATAAWLADIGQ